VNTKNVNIVGLAPLHYCVKYVNKLLEKGIVVIYHTSWPYWDFNSTSNPWPHYYPFKNDWKKFLKLVNAVVCVTNYVCKKIRTLAHGEVHWIPHGVDVSKFYPRKSLKDDGKDKVVILFSGRLVKQKGVLELLKVAQILQNIYRDKVVFLFTGKGRYAALVKSLEHKLPVKLLGHVPRNLLPRVYRRADIFVMPSRRRRNWEETFGLAILEAMSSGLPVIASNHVGPRELIRDGYNGFLVDDKQDTEAFIKDIVNKLIILIEDDKLRRSMGWNGRALVERHYNLSSVMNRWLKLIKSLANY
jgi:glycosyltransferase involved in cell wall biosynthesis